MPVETLLVEAVELLVLGMGAVFLILGLMITCMSILSRFAPSEQTHTPDPAMDESVIAAIQSAIHQYRAQHS